jgi:hypothetical protein
MAYTRTNWVDNVTLVDAVSLNKIETELVALDPLLTVPAKQNAISYGTTPPASPADGDLWCFPADATNGVIWMFRYRAASASAYKWEFVGGPPTSAVVVPAEPVSAVSTWANATTVGPDGVIPRSGDYRVQFTCYCNCASAAVLQMGVANASVGTTPVNQLALMNVAAGAYGNLTGMTTVPGVIIGQTLRAQYNTSVANATFGGRVVTFLPIRVS